MTLTITAYHFHEDLLLGERYMVTATHHQNRDWIVVNTDRPERFDDEIIDKTFTVNDHHWIEAPASSIHQMTIDLETAITMVVDVDVPYAEPDLTEWCHAAATNRICYQRVVDSGPAGGNPIYRIVGMKEDVMEFLEQNEYDAQIEFILSVMS
jgi:molybdopterin-guanine dinucleotide biosynthesis protein A